MRSCACAGRSDEERWNRFAGSSDPAAALRPQSADASTQTESHQKTNKMYYKLCETGRGMR